MFIDNIVDWKNFEKFVQRLYEEDSTLLVEHNQKVVGKSGVSRQIDVLITQKTNLHTYITIAECKWWNKNVTRTIIDEMFATLDDLNASKGAIFTKVGYQKGAKQYAEYKNIDIFVVRELEPEEWGLPGRKIQFYMHMYSCIVQKFDFPGAKLNTSSPSAVPENYTLEIDFKKETALDDNYKLYSDKGKVGLNLIMLLTQQINYVQKVISKKMGVFDEGKDVDVIVESEVEVDFSNYKYKMFKLGFGELIIDKITFSLITHISQSSFNHDRGESFDVVLAVENAIRNQINIVSQKNSEIKTETIIENSEKEKVSEKEDEALKNGSIMNIFLNPWTQIKLDGTESKIKTNKIIIELK